MSSSADIEAIAFAPRKVRKAGIGREPLVLATVEIARCLTQILHEADPTVAARINYAAAKACNRLVEAGEEEAAEIVYAFGRSLLDRSLFPEDESSAALAEAQA